MGKGDVLNAHSAIASITSWEKVEENQSSHWNFVLLKKHKCSFRNEHPYLSEGWPRPAICLRRVFSTWPHHQRCAEAHSPGQNLLELHLLSSETLMGTLFLGIWVPGQRPSPLAQPSS